MYTAASKVENFNKDHLYRLLVRDDPEYQAFVDCYKAKTLAAKCFYLIMHLIPGLLAYLVINVPPVYRLASKLTGLSDAMLQGSFLLAVVFAWHMAVPLIGLRWVDKLSFRESLAFLSLRRFDAKGFFVVMPIVFVVVTLCAVPYFKYVFPGLSDWLAAIPGLNPPPYSIFRDPTVFYGLFPAWFLAIGFVGTFCAKNSISTGI